MNLIIAVTLPRDGFAFAQAHLWLKGLHGDRTVTLVQAEVIGDDGGVNVLPLFELPYSATSARIVVFFPHQPRLVPNSPVERAHMRAWLRYIDEVPSMAIRVPSFQKVFMSRFQTMTEAEFKSFADANPLRRGFLLKIGPDGFSKLDYDIAIDQLARTLQRIDANLAQSSFLCGESYTVADACITPIIVRLEDLGMEGLMAQHPHLRGWYKRIQARPSFGDTYYSGSRLNKGEQISRN
jgi:glutathione S-transferase